MRRWNGQVELWNIALNLSPYDDDNARLSRTLTAATDNVCQALTDVLFESALPRNTTYVWLSNSADMNNVNNAIQGANNEASHWFIQHRLRVESIFTFVSFGPGHSNSSDCSTCVDGTGR